MALPSRHQAPITVSVVIHRQWKLARPLLEQLSTARGAQVARVVLTVNLPEAIDPDPAWCFELQIVFNKQPKGFGANHNAAFAQCVSPWFLVLNPDIRLGANTFDTLLAQALPAAGLLAPRVIEPGKSIPEAHRHLPTPWELWRRRRPGYVPPEQPDWVPGMFMLLRRKAYAAVAGFDERFFLYCEDVDLCARLQLAGWELQVAEGVLVEHDAQRASHKSFQPLLWHVSSALRLWRTPSFWRMRSFLRRNR